MKRILSFVIVAVLVLTLSACSADFADRFTTYTATFSLWTPSPWFDTTDTLPSDIDACMSLYIMPACANILETDNFLETVIGQTGVTLTAPQLREMICMEPITDGTDIEMLKVSVTSDDRQQAVELAQAIAEIAPGFIYELVSVDIEVVDAPTVTESFSIRKLFS